MGQKNLRRCVALQHHWARALVKHLQFQVDVVLVLVAYAWRKCSTDPVIMNSQNTLMTTITAVQVQSRLGGVCVSGQMSGCAG